MPRLRGVCRMAVLVLALIGGGAFMPGLGRAESAPGEQQTALDVYVDKPDPAYAWKLEYVSELGNGARFYVLELTSQKWRDASEVTPNVWKHWLTITAPPNPRQGTAVLFIGGGSNDGKAPREPNPSLASIALGTGAVVANLHTVPNQPTYFADRPDEPLYEDDFIARTWNKHLETDDAEWIAQLPMTKSTVRAMDAVSAFCASKAGGGLEIDNYIVTGASKRGWTTWLTAAVDERVIAIAPLVIDMLNMTRSFEHHHAAYGFWAPAVHPYEEAGILDRIGSPQLEELQSIVDPYAYRERYTMPKYIINSAGDQFFVLDSSQFYYSDLPGPKHLRYVPNTDHGLGRSDVVESLKVFVQSVLNDWERPDFAWTRGKDASIEVTTEDEPLKVNLWRAENPKARDFRLDAIGPAWKSEALEPEEAGCYVGRVEAPSKGWTAFFLELIYPSPGDDPYKFTTGVQVVPGALPYAEPATDGAKKKRP